MTDVNQYVPPVVAITAALMAVIEGLEAVAVLLGPLAGERPERVIAEKTLEARRLMQWAADSERYDD